MGSISSPFTDTELQSSSSSPSSSSSEYHMLLSKLGTVSHGNTLHMLGSSLSSNNAFLGDLSLATMSPEPHPRNTTQPQEMVSIKDANDKQPHKTLPCPRCNSLDTKFCYYNNYNVNQPRHFCKNCQRYWTAGGTLRNVAVGAGRRKRKHSSIESKSGAADSSGTGSDTPNKKASRRKCSKLDDATHQSDEARKPHSLRCLFGNSDLPLHDQKNNPIYGYIGSTSLDRAFYRDDGLALERIGSNMGISYNVEGADKQGICFNLGAVHKVDSSDVDQLINIGLVSESNMLNGVCARSPQSESSSGRQQSMESACTSTITVSQGVGKDSVKLDDLCPEVNQGGDGTEVQNQTRIESNANSTSSINITQMVGSSGSGVFGSPHSLALGLSNLPGQGRPNAFPGVTWPLVHVPAFKKLQDDESERRLWAPKTLRINDPNDAVWSSIWSNLGLKGEGVSFSSSPTKGAFTKKARIPEAQTQHVNPSFTPSVVFQDRS